MSFPVLLEIPCFAKIHHLEGRVLHHLSPMMHVLNRCSTRLVARHDIHPRIVKSTFVHQLSLLSGSCLVTYDDVGRTITRLFRYNTRGTQHKPTQTHCGTFLG